MSLQRTCMSGQKCVRPPVLGQHVVWLHAPGNQAGFKQTSPQTQGLKLVCTRDGVQVLQSKAGD